jgi:hypothetical protein
VHAGSSSEPIPWCQAPRMLSGRRERTAPDLIKEFLPRVLAEGKDGARLVLTVANCYRSGRKMGDFNAVPVSGARAGFPPDGT